MKNLSLVSLLLLLAVSLSAGNCPQNTGGDDDDSASGTPSPTAPQSALSIEFSDLTFTHTFGVTPCPTPVGTITITNSTDTEASYSVSDSGTLISFSSVSGTVPAGESVTVNVEFNCGDCPGAAGLTSTVTVEVGNGAKTNNQTATVTGTFQDCP